MFPDYAGQVCETLGELPAKEPEPHTAALHEVQELCSHRTVFLLMLTI